MLLLNKRNTDYPERCGKLAVFKFRFLEPGFEYSLDF
jgi:hypothetical protein